MNVFSIFNSSTSRRWCQQGGSVRVDVYTTLKAGHLGNLIELMLASLGEKAS